MTSAPTPRESAERWACGHPRTPENSQRVGVAGVRCRICRNIITTRYWRKKKGLQ